MQITNLYRVKNGGKLKAIFTVDTEKVEFRNFKLLENDKGELWATPPSEQYTDKKTQEKKWTYHYRIKDKVLMDKITELARQEFNKDSGGDIGAVPL
jgi:DNA-binding cell septation regulator SpoVG